jgi:hypothetical protein
MRYTRYSALGWAPAPVSIRGLVKKYCSPKFASGSPPLPPRMSAQETISKPFMDGNSHQELPATTSSIIRNCCVSGRRLLECARIVDNEPPAPVVLSAKNSCRDASEGQRVAVWIASLHLVFVNP